LSLILNRTVRHYDSEGNLISEGLIDVDWEDIRIERKRMFKITDLWYLKDRWDNLSTTEKGQLNSFRQAMRDLPQTYDNANDAADNFPIPEDWF
tara:strand:- start:714 stop:995 length:282 start_codon:yes stop_codon:yes gene_type:complete